MFTKVYTTCGMTHIQVEHTSVNDWHLSEPMHLPQLIVTVACLGPWVAHPPGGTDLKEFSASNKTPKPTKYDASEDEPPG